MLCFPVFCLYSFLEQRKKKFKKFKKHGKGYRRPVVQTSILTGIGCWILVATTAILTIFTAQVVIFSNSGCLTDYHRGSVMLPNRFPAGLSAYLLASQSFYIPLQSRSSNFDPSGPVEYSIKPSAQPALRYRGRYQGLAFFKFFGVILYFWFHSWGGGGIS